MISRYRCFFAATAFFRLEYYDNWLGLSRNGTDSFGKVKGGVMTVRFTDREGRIRIIGAGYWRKGKKIYDKENHIHG
jgi:hypothetical protein